MDRISLLPNSLLYHILSFLNTKQVVQTCILSKRWRPVWIHIPTLIFDFNSYSSTENSSSKESSTFKHFIFRVLSEHCGREIQKLCYSSSPNEDEDILAELLICYARCHNVRELCIDIYYINPSDNWKYCFLGFSSLTVLKVICSSYGVDWGALQLPLLTTFEIESACDETNSFIIDEKIELFSGCPSLRSLVLIDYFVEGIACICAPKLENLEFCASSLWELTSHKVELYTPSLKSVKLRNLLPTLKSDSEFSFIQEVCVEVDDFAFSKKGSAFQNLGTNFSQLLKLFRNARSFTLPLKAIETILSVPFRRFSLRNMRHLKLKTNGANKLIDLPIGVLTNLLKYSNLKTLAVLNEANKNRTLWGFGCC